MKNLIFIVLTVILHLNVSAQKIFISGEETNRQLVWSDFTGRPDASSPYFAMTNWNISYKFGNVRFIGDSVRIGSFEAVLKLDPVGSWLKKEKATDELLKHEQGHFDIGILCLRELVAKVEKTSFTKVGFNNAIQNIFNTTIAKYKRMGEQYDNETVHSKHKENQLKWNDFLQTALEK